MSFNKKAVTMTAFYTNRNKREYFKAKSLQLFCSVYIPILMYHYFTNDEITLIYNILTILS